MGFIELTSTGTIFAVKVSVPGYMYILKSSLNNNNKKKHVVLRKPATDNAGV